LRWGLGFLPFVTPLLLSSEPAFENSQQLDSFGVSLCKLRYSRAGAGCKGRWVQRGCELGRGIENGPAAVAIFRQVWFV